MNERIAYDFLEAYLIDLDAHLDRVPLAFTIGDDLYIRGILYNIAFLSRTAKRILKGESV